VFHSLRGCHLNNLEATKIELALEDMGIPMLKLESEYDEGDIEQIRTRVEAFVEMIKARKKAQRRKKREMRQKEKDEAKKEIEREKKEARERKNE